MRPAWPPFCWIFAYKGREEKRNTEAMGRLGTQRLAQRGRPAVPDQWTGRPGGSGAQPPLHLIYMVKVGRHFFSTFRHCRLRSFMSRVQSGIVYLLFIVGKDRTRKPRNCSVRRLYFTLPKTLRLEVKVWNIRWLFPGTEMLYR